MKKALIFGIIFGLLLGSTCAKKKPVGGVEHQSRSVPFTGYKITVEVKARPEQVEEWLLDFRNLDLPAGAYRMRVLSGNQMEKLGDSVDGRVEIAGVGIPGKVILIYRKPGSEMWFLFNGKSAGLGILRYYFKEIPSGTRVSMKFEVGELDPFLKSLAEGSLRQAIAGIVEKAIAAGQAHFDPSVTPEQLMEKGIRGEFYDTFYQGHQAAVWINARPKKVADYLVNPETWEKYRGRYGLDFSKCMVAENAKPCPMKFKVFGMDYDINTFPTSYKYADNSESFWVAKQMIARFKITLRPERGGTRLTVDYIMELPPSFSQEGGTLLMNILQIPDLLGRLLVNVKNDNEHAS